MKRLLMLVLLILVCDLNGAVFFSDDFESGNLNQWTISGRQLGVTNIAEVVDKYGSKMGHLYHEGFTEICIEKTFAYEKNLTFSFDFEATVTANCDYASGDYTSGEAEFTFLDSQNNQLGLVSYVKASSDWIFNYWASSKTTHLLRIPNNADLVSYNTVVVDLLNYITLDESSIASVKLRFFTYGSDSFSTFTSNVWVDNVVVTPEPTTIALLGMGIIAIFRKN